jgi:hypothetical protein
MYREAYVTGVCGESEGLSAEAELAHATAAAPLYAATHTHSLLFTTHALVFLRYTRIIQVCSNCCSVVHHYL